MIDFSGLHAKEITLEGLAVGLNRDDLVVATNAMCGLQLALIADADDSDAAFVPDDPDADDPYAEDDSERGLSWTLGHVVAHSTASSEEAAAMALILARGLPAEGRSRHEVPWETVTTADAMRMRIQESRRMRLAMLDAWPDRPALDNFRLTRDGQKLNAIARFLAGLSHDDQHLGQIRRIMEQGRSRRTTAPATGAGVGQE